MAKTETAAAPPVKRDGWFDAVLFDKIAPVIGQLDADDARWAKTLIRKRSPGDDQDRELTAKDLQRAKDIEQKHSL